MKMRVVKQIGKNPIVFEVEGSNLFECQMEAEKLSFHSVKKCGICEGEHLYLKAYKAQDKYKYVKVCCANPDCRASLTFGQKQDDPDTFYFRRNPDKTLEWKQYNNGNAAQEY